MAHSIEKIKSTLKGGGARPNLFQVNLTSFPGGADYDSDEFSVLARLLSCLHLISLQSMFLSEEESLRLLETVHLIPGL